MKLKSPAALELIKDEMTMALPLQAAAAILGAFLGLVIVVLLVLGATTAVAILCGFRITYLGAAVAAFVLGGIVGGVLVYEIIERPGHNADRVERPLPVRG